MAGETNGINLRLTGLRLRYEDLRLPKYSGEHMRRREGGRKKLEVARKK